LRCYTGDSVFSGFIPKNTISRSVPFPAPIAHFNAPDQWSRARSYWARVDHDVYFKLEPAARRSSAKTYSECRLEMPAQLIRFRNLTRAGQPIAERVNIHLMDFNFIFNEATLALPRVPLASQRNCRV
jgi:hypothetical protein